MNPFVVVLILVLVLLCLLGGICALSPLQCPEGTHKCCPDNNRMGPLCHCIPLYTPCPPGQIDFGGEPPTPRP